MLKFKNEKCSEPSPEGALRRRRHCLARDQSTLLTAISSLQSFGLLQSSSSSKNGIDGVLWSDSSRLGNLPTSRKGWWRFLDCWVVSGTTFVFALFCFACVADWSEQTRRLYKVLCVFCFTTFSRTSLPHSFSSLYVPQLWSPLWGHVRLCVLGPLGSTLATLFWCPAAEPNYVNRQTRTNSFSRSVSISKQFSKLLWRTHRGSIHCTALLDFTVTGLMGGRQLAIAASGQSCFYCFTVSRCWGQHVLHCCLNWGLVLWNCVTAQLSLFLAQAIPGDWLAPVRRLCFSVSLAFVCLSFSLPRPNTLSVYYRQCVV